MPTANLGRVQPIYKGVYNSAAAYAPLDLVKYAGTVYWCVAAAAATVDPTSAAHWVALTAQELLDYGVTASAAELNILTGTSATAGDLNLLSTQIGRPFAVWDHIPGCPLPSNAGARKFIKLTAGLTGIGSYNYGLLTAESVSGTAPAITATAIIVGGPMAGQTVPLVNTEQAFIRPATVSGVLQDSQNLAHQHTLTILAGTGGSIGGYAAYSGSGTAKYIAESAGGAESRPRNRSATLYMRII